MKEVIKHYFPLILTVLCAMYGLLIFFHGFTNSQNGIFSDIGTYFSDGTQKDNLTYVANQMGAQEKAPLPTPKYIGNTITVGEAVSFDKLFTLEFTDGTLSTVEETPTAALYLVDVTHSNGTSVLMKLSSADVENLEELSTAAVYDTDNRLLYFHSSGIYTLYIRLYFNYQSGVLFQCQIPVEVG